LFFAAPVCTLNGGFGLGIGLGFGIGISIVFVFGLQVKLFEPRLPSRLTAARIP
jgi:hypothetical protein